MTAGGDLATERLRELVEGLRTALGGGRGWQATAAALLNVTGPYVSRLLNPDDSLRVGSDVVQRIHRAHGVPLAFFHDVDHAQPGSFYAGLFVDQVGLLERPDHRRPVVSALNAVIAAAERARAVVLEGVLPVAVDELAVSSGAALVELGAYRERVSR